MDTLEVLTLLLVVFAALTYIDNKHNPQINGKAILYANRGQPVIRLIFKLIICFRLCNRWTHQNPSVSKLIINQPCRFCKRFRKQGCLAHLYFFAHLQVWSILFFQLLLCSIRRRGSSEILIKIRDTSLWKFVPFSRQAECEKFRLCHDTGSACYGCFRHSQRVCRCLENYSFGTEGTGKVKDR